MLRAMLKGKRDQITMTIILCRVKQNIAHFSVFMDFLYNIENVSKMVFLEHVRQVNHEMG